ncbi:MAG: peptidoglycan-binding protein [Eubacteriales bacterium]|nr:peptidoglycan-binding protein [Eubacteriales bacterium]
MDSGRNYGTFRIILRKGIGFTPASGAVIQVARGGAAAASVYADANGEAHITLPSADFYKSQIPSPPSLPYVAYEIKASLAGYIPVLFKGVQIFPGIVTSCRYDMIRTPDQPKKRNDVINIPPHKLSTGVPTIRAEDNNTMEADLCSAVSEVTVPENITIHLGAPTSDDENVTVPFIDYIKSVASGELYPTWPEAALKTNIIAEVSMALNRIHTKWYRARGYNFDITSLPEYDRAYTHGCPTFEITDKLVNRLFDKYAVKTKCTEPVLAICFDGYITEGEGLSQWGSVELAKQYYTPFDILRYYYGDDVYIKAAAVQEAIPDSFPGDMSLGADCEDAALAQYRINRIAVNNPGMLFTETADGNYGESTVNAVKKFQSFFGLKTTGIIDKATWYRIHYIYNTEKKLTETEKEKRYIHNDGYPGYMLSMGDRDLSVLKMRHYLNKLSQYLGKDIIQPIPVNGIFDTQLRNAVYSFQNYCGITLSGVIDEETWNTVVTAFYDIPKDMSPESVTYPGTPVRYGDSGGTVKFIQYALNTVGNGRTEIPRLEEDGIYGDLTRNALKAFQKHYGLAADGIAGPLTWARLYSEYTGVSGETAGQP